MKNVTAGANPMDIRRGMSKAVATAVETIKAHSQKVKDSNDIARVGTISAGDPEIGRLIAEAMEKVTSDGVITIEENKTTAERHHLVGIGGHIGGQGAAVQLQYFHGLLGNSYLTSWSDGYA